MRLIIDPQNFADYDVYHSIVSNLIGSSIDSPYEWLSYKTFQTVGDIFVEPTAATYYVYLLNSIIFSIVMIYVVRHKNINSGGILISFAIFSPLMYFVTLRATPAYLLILCSIIFLDKENKKLSIASLLVAILYHISALIPAFVIIILMIKPVWTDKKLKYITFLIYMVSIIQIITFIFSYNLIPTWMSEEINASEYLEKYSSYADISQNFSISHYVYLSFVLVLFFTLRRWRAHIPVVMYSYAHLMMLIYSAMMISPVTAYRLSLFFLFPLLLVFPWNKILGRIKGVVYYFVMPFIFIFSLIGVLVK